MPELPMNRLKTYFQGIADSFEAEKTASRVLSNRGDAGSVREDTLKNFLEKHVPSRCQVIKGGFIFDVHNRESKQIDIIIANDLTIQFRQFDKAFSCIEGCYCAISVKTTLDKAQLFDSLDNLASIPPMPDLTAQISPVVGNKADYNNMPMGVIFAYDGLELPTIGEHLNEYSNLHPEIPINRRPDLIIVNNKYIIVKSGFNGGKYRDGTPVSPNQLIPSTHKDIGGYSLLFLLNMLQKVAAIGSHLALASGHYVDAYPLL